MKALRLAVDARDLASDTRGIGRYTRAILPRLAKRPDIKLVLLVFGPFSFRHRVQISEALGTERFEVSTKPTVCDVLWHPANGTFFAANAPNVVTIHDAFPFRFPEESLRRRKHQQEPFLRSARTARKVIAVSQFDRAEILEVFGIDPARIEVIYHGVDAIFSQGPPLLPPDLPEPYFIFVGDPDAEPRKNFRMLYEAYRAAFPEPQGRPALVVLRRVRGEPEGVFYAGPPSGQGGGPGDTLLRDLYRGALALCIPSYYEGFGMPILEAMACGTPVVASQASCLPEIGSDAALYAPAHDVNAWVEALRRIAGDGELRARLREAGLQRVRAFSWEESARRHAEIFHSL